MRLKRSDLTEIAIFSRFVEKDSEGGTCENFKKAGTVKAIVWPGSGKAQATVYGERLNSIINIEIDGDYSEKTGETVPTYVVSGDIEICQLDAVSLGGSDQPEYQIISIRAYGHLRLEAERIVCRKS